MTKLAAGWLLVLVWCSTLPGLAPAVFAALARVEGSHRVEVCGAGEDVRVVLSHGSQNRGREHERIHHHCPLARLLTALAVPDENQPDHVVKFGSVTRAESEYSLDAPAAPLTAELAAPIFVVFQEIPQPRSERAVSWPEGAPPGVARRAGLVELRSTLLLI